MKFRRLNGAAGQPQPRPLPETLVELRTKAVLNGAAAVGVLLGVGVLADRTGYTDLAWLGLASIILALRAVWLWQDTSREALRLPQKPERKTPPHWLRVWWWLRSRPPRVKPAAEPFRRVRVGDNDEVLMPHMPGDMRKASEPVVVADYTNSDLYMIVCKAFSVGLSERATDENGQPVWLFGDGQRMQLPSGAQLSRDGFRAVQAWLVKQKFATAKPSYAFMPGVTPEVILETL